MIAIVLMFVAIAVYAGDAGNMPLGMRINNPFNLRPSMTEKWDGQIGVHVGKFGSFAKFISLNKGLRAGFHLLHTYIVKNNLNSIDLIAQRFAPSGFVTQEGVMNSHWPAGVKSFYGPSYLGFISWNDREMMVKLARAIISQEQGPRFAKTISDSMLYSAYDAEVNERK